MRKILLPILWLGALLLSACKTATTAVPPTATTRPPATPITIPTQAPGCTVTTKMPTPEPTQEAMFGPVTEGEWVRGPEDAAVTIIEYSDFQ